MGAPLNFSLRCIRFPPRKLRHGVECEIYNNIWSACCRQNDGRLRTGETYGFRLFHNHLTIELVLNFFEFGQPQFHTFVYEFRRRVFKRLPRAICQFQAFQLIFEIFENLRKFLWTFPSIGGIHI